MKAAAKTSKRERPEDGGIVWHDRWNAFECRGCTEWEEIRCAHDRTPERLAIRRELLVIDHTECWEFDDPKMALDARKHRSEKKRRELLKQQGAGLASQRAGWRGN